METGLHHPEGPPVRPSRVRTRTTIELFDTEVSIATAEDMVIAKLEWAQLSASHMASVYHCGRAMLRTAMNLFKVNVTACNPKREELETEPVEAVVDTGSELTWLPSEVLNRSLASGPLPV